MKKKFAIITAALMTASIALFADSNYDLTPKISVQGTGKISVPADQVEISIGVKTTNVSAKEAINKNTEKMKAVKDVLTKIGIPEKEYKTSGFNLSPIWSKAPRNYDASYEKKIVSYSVTNAYRIKTQKIDLSGELIAKSAEAGANNISDINFGIAKPQDYRKEAIQFAIKNARSDADAIAEAANQKIEKILNINLNNFYVPTARMSNKIFAAEGVMDSVQNIPVNPGEISIDVSVNVTYKIKEIK